MKCQDLREKAVIFHRLPPPLPLWIRLFFYIEMFTLKKNVSLWIERERESKREREFLSVIIIYLVITVGGRQLLARKKQHQQSGKVVCSFFLKCRKHASAHCSACFLFFKFNCLISCHSTLLHWKGFLSSFSGIYESL